MSRPQRNWERRKSGRVALVSSLLVPGLGQLYNEREFWALVAVGVESYFIGNIVVEQRLTNRYRALANDDEIVLRRCVADSSVDCTLERQQFDLDQALFVLHRDNRIQSTWVLGLVMLVSGLQAFVDAHLFDFDTSSPPQVRFEPIGLDGRPGAALRFHF